MPTEHPRLPTHYQAILDAWNATGSHGLTACNTCAHRQQRGEHGTVACGCADVGTSNAP